ncbi:MAG: hypothetical protein M1365_07605, partial [Actinobacteria bacterium]|nr:hypothetical protein [Actinomycetota bacterium]
DHFFCKINKFPNARLGNNLFPKICNNLGIGILKRKFHLSKRKDPSPVFFNNLILPFISLWISELVKNLMCSRFSG